MSACCHTCPLWVQIRGVNAEGKDIADEWNCTLPSLLTVMIANMQQTHQAGASADKVATEVRESADRVAKEVALLHQHMRDANVLNSAILLDGQSNTRGLLITADKANDGGPS
jgi:hypothetical protein